MEKEIKKQCKLLNKKINRYGCVAVPEESNIIGDHILLIYKGIGFCYIHEGGIPCKIVKEVENLEKLYNKNNKKYISELLIPF